MGTKWKTTGCVFACGQQQLRCDVDDDGDERKHNGEVRALTVGRGVGERGESKELLDQRRRRGRRGGRDHGLRIAARGFLMVVVVGGEKGRWGMSCNRLTHTRSRHA